MAKAFPSLIQQGSFCTPAVVLVKVTRIYTCDEIWKSDRGDSVHIRCDTRKQSMLSSCLLSPSYNHTIRILKMAVDFYTLGIAVFAAIGTFFFGFDTGIVCLLHDVSAGYGRQLAVNEPPLNVN